LTLAIGEQQHASTEEFSLRLKPDQIKKTLKNHKNSMMSSDEEKPKRTIIKEKAEEKQPLKQKHKFCFNSACYNLKSVRRKFLNKISYFCDVSQTALIGSEMR
jgi:hypothetical protein